MALAELDKHVLDDIQPQARIHSEELMGKIGILAGQPVVVTETSLKKGTFSDLFKFNPRASMVSHMTWDGREGNLYYLVPVEFGIVVAGFMMGLPANRIQEKLATVDFDAELKEAYGEVANQLWGGVNQLLVAKIDKNIHLSLKETKPWSGSGDVGFAVDTGQVLLVLNMTCQFADLKPVNIILAISSNLVPEIYKTEIGGLSHRFHSQGPRGGSGEIIFNVTSIPAPDVTAEQLMNPAYPTIELDMTIGDAYDCMKEKNVESLAVVEDGRILKVVTLNDVEVIRSVFFNLPGHEERSARLMCIPLNQISRTQELKTITPQSHFSDVAKILSSGSIQNLPVVDENRHFLGMITTRQLLESFCVTSESID